MFFGGGFPFYEVPSLWVLPAALLVVSAAAASRLEAHLRARCCAGSLTSQGNNLLDVKPAEGVAFVSIAEVVETEREVLASRLDATTTLGSVGEGGASDPSTRITGATRL